MSTGIIVGIVVAVVVIGALAFCAMAVLRAVIGSSSASGPSTTGWLVSATAGARPKLS